MIQPTNLNEQSFDYTSTAAMPTAQYNKSSQTAYKQTAIETASPENLLVMLYKGTVKFLRKGEQALLENEYETANENLTRALDIVAELNATLNMEAGAVAENLRSLYNFYIQEILTANIKRNPEPLKPAIDFFEEFTKVWSDAASAAVNQD